MTLADMSDRCLRIGSAGKTFSLTGWEVGYVSASEDLVKTVSRAHQFLTFTTPPSLQRAVAYGLGKDADYFAALAGEMQRKRDALRAGLEGVGFEVLDSAGTYFLSADFRPLGFTGDDLTFCRRITTEAGVAAVPVSAFYRDAEVRHFARFCFCKKDEVLAEAIARLARWQPSPGPHP